MNLRGRCATFADDLSQLWKYLSLNPENVAVVEDADTGTLVAGAVLFDGGHEAVPIDVCLLPVIHDLGVQEVLILLSEAVRDLCEGRGRTEVVVQTTDPSIYAIFVNGGATPIGVSYMVAVQLTPDPAAAA